MKTIPSNWLTHNQVALRESHALLNNYGIGIHHPGNFVVALNNGHSIACTQKVNGILQAAANKAIADGLSKKEIRNAILKALDDIARTIKDTTPKMILP